jgi:hypothetical protein
MDDGATLSTLSATLKESVPRARRAPRLDRRDIHRSRVVDRAMRRRRDTVRRRARMQPIYSLIAEGFDEQLGRMF